MSFTVFKYSYYINIKSRQKKKKIALAGVAQWIEGWPVTKGLLV